MCIYKIERVHFQWHGSFLQRCVDTVRINLSLLSESHQGLNFPNDFGSLRRDVLFQPQDISPWNTIYSDKLDVFRHFQKRVTNLCTCHTKIFIHAQQKIILRCLQVYTRTGFITRPNKLHAPKKFSHTPATMQVQ